MKKINIKKYLFWANILFASANTEGLNKNDCERCVKTEECASFTYPNRHESTLEQVPCKLIQTASGSTVVEPLSTSEGDYVCCPKLSIWEKENDNETKQPNREVTNSVRKRSAYQDGSQNYLQYRNQPDLSRGVLNLGDQCAKKASMLPSSDTLCCGINISALDNSVSDGVTREIDMFPWSTIISLTFETDYHDKVLYTCEGAFISRLYVLTAAHCVDRRGALLEKVTLMLTNYDEDCKFRTMPDNPFETVPDCLSELQGERVIIHEKFVIDQPLNDVALIKVKELKDKQYIAPVCLPTFNVNDKFLADEVLIVTNWVTASNYKEALDLGIHKDIFIKQASLVFHVPHDECSTKFYPHLDNTHICVVSHSKGIRTEGKSGSPLMMLYKGSYYLIGLYSSNKDITFDRNVGPPLYTNVHLHLPWIQKNIKDLDIVYA